MKRVPPTAATPRCFVVLLLMAALASACGYHLRGSPAQSEDFRLPEDFREIYVEGPVEITDEIAIFLESGGASVVAARGEADAAIKVQSENYTERVVSVDATTGKAREFELLYTLDFSIRMKDGTMLMPAEHIVVRRIFVFDPTAVIGATQNVEVLRQDMRRDAAERIIRLTEAALGK